MSHFLLSNNVTDCQHKFGLKEYSLCLENNFPA